MLRSNGDCGKVRKGHCLYVPDCTIHEAPTWGGKRVISSMFAQTTRPFIPSRKKQPGFKNLQRGCRISTPAILVEVSTFDKVPHGSPASNGSNHDRRSWCNAWSLDKTKAETRADWVTWLFYLVGTGMKLRMSKWQVSSVTQGINFLGYRIWGSHKLIRKDSVSRAKTKVSRFLSTGDTHSLVKFINSWSGHAKWADTHNLFSWMENRHGITV